jgi:hypothetical protein
VTDWPMHRIAWRDAALDRLVDVLAKNQDTADFGRRLRSYVQTAREIERQEYDGWDGVRSCTRLAEWTAERLPELERKRSDSALRSQKEAMLGLEGHFRAWQSRCEEPRLAIGTRRNKLRRRAWRACVRLAERNLAKNVAAGRLPGPMRRLTPSQRDEVIFTQAGKIRAPKAAAFELLYLAIPHRADRENFRTQLAHVKLAPPAL